MGIGIGDIEYLSAHGHLDGEDVSVLDVGTQNLYNATPERVRALVERHGGVRDAAGFEAEAARLSYFSTPRPGERTTYLSELLDLTAMAYASFDVCPGLRTEILDLNTAALPPAHRLRHQVVLNFGTTEHLVNQYNALRLMHEALCVGGVVFHQVPAAGWAGHGYFCYHEGFFHDLARANGYEVLDHWYTVAGQGALPAIDLRDADQPLHPGPVPRPAALDAVINLNLNFVARKRADTPFAVALELATSHAAPDAAVAQRYGLGGGGAA